MALKVVIYTPKGKYLEEFVSSLTLKTITGYRTILDGHVDLISTLDYAPMHIYIGDNVRYYAVQGGAFRLEKNVATIITNTIERSDSIDVDRALAAKKRAEDRIAAHDENTDLRRAELALKRAINRIQTAENN